MQRRKNFRLLVEAVDRFDDLRPHRFRGGLIDREDTRQAREPALEMRLDHDGVPRAALEIQDLAQSRALLPPERRSAVPVPDRVGPKTAIPLSLLADSRTVLRKPYRTAPLRPAPSGATAPVNWEEKKRARWAAQLSQWELCTVRRPRARRPTTCQRFDRACRAILNQVRHRRQTPPHSRLRHALYADDGSDTPRPQARTDDPKPMSDSARAGSAGFAGQDPSGGEADAPARSGAACV